MVAFSRRLLKTRIILETKADRQSLLVETVYQWSGRGGGTSGEVHTDQEISGDLLSINP